MGGSNLDRLDTATSNLTAYDQDINYLTTYTPVPIDFSEWFFIVASFNKDVTEDPTSEPGLSNLQNQDFWRNNVDADGYTDSSNLGAMCKVEVISKSDLLRARGFQV